MIEVRPWHKEKDFAQVKEWGFQYNKEYREHQFPKTGFIVDGVAAYFLYSTDSSCCWLENMIANKKTDPDVRDKALQMICEAILAEAKKLGFKVAYATTDNISVVKRAVTMGARFKPAQILLIKDLDLS